MIDNEQIFISSTPLIIDDSIEKVVRGILSSIRSECPTVLSSRAVEQF